jgi:hypothetical protein
MSSSRSHPAAIGRRNLNQRLLDRNSIVVAWITLAIAAIHPPHETGISICWMHSTTGIPCPGCGMIRSVSCAAHGLWERSVAYHPFGVPALAMFAFIAAASILPRSMKAPLENQLRQRARPINVLLWIAVGSFLAFGVIRAMRAFASITF